MFTKKTVRNIDIKGQRVLLRIDANVPLNKDGTIADDFRLRQALPTIEYLRAEGAKVIVCSHLGRPSGTRDPKLSLRPAAEKLTELLGTDVRFATDCVGDEVTIATGQLESGDVLLLENLRFNPGEESNNSEFAKQLAQLADVFVQDAFGVVHRSHASTDAITRELPSVAGLLLEKEVDTITRVMSAPERPLMAIVGGAKISDKIGVLQRFIEVADFVAVGGAMANTFLAAEGIDVAESRYEPNDVPIARDILQAAREKAKRQRFAFYVPQDGVVAKESDSAAHTRIVDWNAHVIAEVESYPRQPHEDTRTIAPDEKILDIGPFSGAFIAGGVQLANTVVWNGTMGVTEIEPLMGSGPVGPFSQGTELLVDALLGQYGHRPFSLVGGGDTVSYLAGRRLTNSFNHVSTGGGASLALMAGKKLPGVEALPDK